MLVETTHLTQVEYYISLAPLFYRESWQNDICSFIQRVKDRNDSATLKS